MKALDGMIVLAEGSGDKLVVGALLGFMMLGVGGAVLFMVARAFRGWLGGDEPRLGDPDEEEGEKEKNPTP